MCGVLWGAKDFEGLPENSLPPGSREILSQGSRAKGARTHMGMNTLARTHANTPYLPHILTYHTHTNISHHTFTTPIHIQYTPHVLLPTMPFMYKSQSQTCYPDSVYPRHTCIHTTTHLLHTYSHSTLLHTRYTHRTQKLHWNECSDFPKQLGQKGTYKYTSSLGNCVWTRILCFKCLGSCS